MGRENKGTLILNYPDTSGLGLHSQYLCLDLPFSLAVEAFPGGLGGGGSFVTHPPTPFSPVVSGWGGRELLRKIRSLPCNTAAFLHRDLLLTSNLCCFQLLWALIEEWRRKELHPGLPGSVLSTVVTGGLKSCWRSWATAALGWPDCPEQASPRYTKWTAASISIAGKKSGGRDLKKIILCDPECKGDGLIPLYYSL